MPRSARIVIPGLPHHVYLRGNNRRRLFSRSSDYKMFLACLRLGIRESGCLLHQLTLMTNHVHMVPTPQDRDGLARLVHVTCQRYAQRRNALRDASGKLFEERFHSKVIDNDLQLMATLLYNDANAFRAGLSTGPTTHRWSTGPLHAGSAAELLRDLWTPSSWYAALGTTAAAREHRYVEQMSRYTAAGASPVMTMDDSAWNSDARRVQRPDGSTAREVPERWVLKGER